MKQNIATVFTLLTNASEQAYIGEPVSQLEHALQAAYFAKQDSETNPALIAAALLHDVGHLIHDSGTKYMADLGVLHHEDIGAMFLRELGFQQEVCDLVKSHVSAKRYLVSKFDTYKARLSDASRQTLEYQGGFMSDEEIIEFERDPNFKSFLKLRHFDDAAKRTDLEVPNLQSYIPVLEQVC